MPSAPTNVACPVDGAHNPALVATPKGGGSPAYTYQVVCRTGDFTAASGDSIKAAVANWNAGLSA